MKKCKEYLKLTFLALLLEIAGCAVLSFRPQWVASIHAFRKLSVALAAFWFFAMVFLLIKKGRLSKVLSKALTICNIVFSALLLLFFGAFLLLPTHSDQGEFSLNSSLFTGKDVMIVIPHQDDDINLMGGLIEQYTGAGSKVTVVFSTNGDGHGDQEIRAAETVSVLTELGVAREDICYLGFGDQWQSQTFEGAEIAHIYNSPDPDLVWTSRYGATQTYGTSLIDCYLDLPYTRSNYVYSFQSILLEKRPDTIFVVDYDDHIDHKATTLFFDEALCNVLTATDDYHPTVYQGFCYGTAWHGADDYFESINLLSSKLPEDDIWAHSAFGHAWQERVRFPMSSTNLNFVLTNNSVSDALDKYASQKAFLQTTRILNGDKVFWHRRTDSLLYGASVSVGSEKTAQLTDFKLKDFRAIGEPPLDNVNVAALSEYSVTVTPAEAICANRIYLYDNPDASANILEGYILFSDGSRLDFDNLKADGSPTVLSFEEKNIFSMQIVITASGGEAAGLCEIEAFYDVPDAQEEETFLMAVDHDDNFVYDYLLSDTTTAFRVGSFPAEKQLGAEDITLSFTADGNATCRWEGDLLIVDCPRGDRCIITVSDGTNSTTFSVTNPGSITRGYLLTLRQLDKLTLNMRTLVSVVQDFVQYYIDIYL